MYFYSRKLKQPSKKQLELWSLKRKKLSGKEIAAQKNVTTGFVSKTLSDANQRIRGLLENAANMNKVSIENLSEELGFARGKSHMLNVKCYITFSPRNGVQVWYEHKGNCASCEKFALCKDILLKEFEERSIEIPSSTLQPTDLVEVLFNKLEEIST